MYMSNTDCNKKVFCPFIFTTMNNILFYPFAPMRYIKACYRGCHGRDHMVVGFTTTYAIMAYYY